MLLALEDRAPFLTLWVEGDRSKPGSTPSLHPRELSLAMMTPVVTPPTFPLLVTLAEVDREEMSHPPQLQHRLLR